MARYLLDTCTLSDFFKGDSRTRARIQLTQPIQVAVSTVTVMEIRYGFELNPSIKKKFQSSFEAFLTVSETISFDHSSAIIAAKLRAELKTRGTPIGAWDLLIASTALAHGLILVTSNTREFNFVPSLKIENWRETT